MTSFAFKVGAAPPSNQHLRNMKKVVTALSPKAFKTIKELSEYDTNSKVIDGSAITITYLTRKSVVDLKDRPTEQALCVQLLAR